MKRRPFLASTAAIVCVAAGCSEPTVTENPTGELDVSFRTEADRSHLITFELVDADGRVEDEFGSEFPPDEEGAPSFYGAGLARGPYTVTIATETDEASFEWSVTECASLDVDVTVLADGTLDVERTCADG